MKIENNLSHLIDHPDDIHNIHVTGRLNLSNEHEHGEIFNYSMKGFLGEVVGRESDADIVTSTGHTKIGILGQAPHEANQRRKREREMRVHLLNEHMSQQLAELRARLAEIDAEIAARQKNIDKINQELSALDELQELLNDEDFDPNTPEGRKRVARLSRKAGLSNLPDGDLDKDDLRRRVEDRTETRTDDRDAEQDALDAAKEERKVVQAEFRHYISRDSARTVAHTFSSSPEMQAELAQLASRSINHSASSDVQIVSTVRTETTPSIADTDVALDTVTQDDITLDVLDSLLFDLGALEDDLDDEMLIFASEDSSRLEDIAPESPNGSILSLAADAASSRSLGSFAIQNDEDAPESVITAQFSTAALGLAADSNPDVSADATLLDANNDTNPAASTSTGTVSYTHLRAHET